MKVSSAVAIRNRLPRRALAGVLLIGALLLGQREAYALDSVSLQLKWLHQFQFAGYYQALEQGFYRDAGFDVDIRQGGPNVDPSTEVGLGKADYGVCTSGLLVRKPTDPKLVSLAVVFQHSAAVILVTRASGISTMAQLAGRPFMDTPDSESLAAMLKRAGVSYADLPRVEHQGDPRDLISGKADAMVAYSTNEPFIMEELGVPYRMFSPRAVGIDFYGDNLCTSERLVAASPERVAAFRAASLKGWQYALAHKEETVDLILKRYSSQKSRDALLYEADQTEDLVQPDLVEFGYQNPERWQKMAETYHDLGMMKEAAVPDGLIYTVHEGTIPTWLKYGFGGLLLFGAAASVVVSRSSALNRRLKSENFERKRAESALQDALAQAEAERTRARTIIDSTPDPALIVRRDGTIDYVNRQGVAMLGFTPEELIGTSVERLVPASARAGHPSHMKDFFSAGKPRQMGSDRELTVVTKSLREIPVEISLSPMDYLGERMVIASLRDVTQKKQLQGEINAALADAKTERARTDSILAGAPDPIVIVTSDSRIEYVNDQVTRIFGYSASELIGQSLEMLIPQRFRPGHQSQVHGFFDANKVRFMGVGRELFALTKSGQEIPVAIALSPVKAGDKSVVVAAIRDVTDQKEAEKAVREARDAAEAATKAKGDFLASMSHEIRTPMNGITGMADMLAQTKLDDDQHQMLKTICNSGNSLLTIINDILDFSKIEAGKLDIEDISMSVADAVEGVATTLAPNARGKSIRIHTFIDPELPVSAQGDPVRIRQILFNLVGNGIKFSNKKDVAVRAIRANGYGEATWVRFEVIDQGIGISPENQAKLFQAFGQAEASTTRRFGGTGLGLAICKRLVELMGGKIGVTSKEGSGSTFWVELPLTPTDRTRIHEKPRDLSGLRVVIVGATDARRDTLVSYLSHWGAEAIVAESLEQARVLIKGQPPVNSVIVDFDFDIKQQELALTELRNDVAAANARIILMEDDQNRGARVVGLNVVTVGANPLLRYRFITAVAVASGRASPQMRSDANATPMEKKTAPTIAEAKAAGQLILLAEDNLTNQDVIRRQLGMLGYACEITNDGKEALAAWRKGSYAMLITDCHMPEMDGYELTGAIREAESGTGARLPIIAATANALQGEAERCLAAGMDDYISKPIGFPALRAVLSKWMPDGSAAGAPAVPLLAEPTQPTVAVVASDGNGAAINDRAIKDMFGDDDATFKEILADFLPVSQAIVNDIMAAANAGKPGDVAKEAHKLKSAARSVGATALADVCVALEAAGKSNDVAAIATLAPQVPPLMAAVAAYIEAL